MSNPLKEMLEWAKKRKWIETRDRTDEPVHQETLRKGWDQIIAYLEDRLVTAERVEEPADAVDPSEVFRKASRTLRMSTPYGTLFITSPCMTTDDFKTRRGIHFDLCMEDLQDTLTGFGPDAAALQIGQAVLGLIDAAQVEEAKT